MYDILLPVDDSVERATTQAEFVTGLPVEEEAVEVTVTHALHDEELEAPDAMRTPGRVATVKHVREHLESAGLEVTLGELVQPPSDGILKLADDIDADLIVLGGRKQSPAGKVLFGSVTQAVLLNTDRSVVVTGSGGD